LPDQSALPFNNARNFTYNTKKDPRMKLKLSKEKWWTDYVVRQNAET